MDLQSFLHDWLPKAHQKATREVLRQAKPHILATLSQLESIDLEFSINGIALRFFQNRFLPLEASTPARRVAIESDITFLESLVPLWIKLTPRQDTQPSALDTHVWMKALQEESLTFAFTLLDSPFQDAAPVTVTLGLAAADLQTPKPEFHARLKWQDIEAVRAGSLRWTDLLLGKLKIEGDMGGVFRLSMKLMELQPKASGRLT